MRVQYTQNANVSIRSQSHLIRNIVQALEFQPFKLSHLRSPASQKWKRMRANLPVGTLFSLNSTYNRNFVKTEIATMLAIVCLKSFYFATDCFRQAQVNWSVNWLKWVACLFQSALVIIFSICFAISISTLMLNCDEFRRLVNCVSCYANLYEWSHSTLLIKSCRWVFKP